MNPNSILDFWFAHPEKWFGGGPEFDAEIRARFEDWLEPARRGELDAWRAEARSALALVIVLDQFPRNLFRGSARAFDFDSKAREIALESISKGFDRVLRIDEATFVYLPFEHAEDLALQAKSVALCEGLVSRAHGDEIAIAKDAVEWARRHQVVILRFGRFPHRNASLGRTSTQDEAIFLAENPLGF